MRRRHVSIIAVLASLGGAMLATPALAQSSGEPTASTGAAAGFMTPANFGERFHHRWGRGHRFARLCSDRREEHVNRVVDFVEGFMEFTPEQERTWGDLKNAVEASNTKVDEACATLDDGDGPQSTPERLARLETLMSTGLAVIHEVRPAFEAFYATLSEKQQRALDRLVERGRRH